MENDYSTDDDDIVENVRQFARKRKYLGSEDEDEEINNIIRVALRTPKKKKLLCTEKYMYQTLFLEGKDSDITICALGKEHHLHKLYLCQSPYFASMFSGSWLETNQKSITIDVVDPLITLEALQVAFGSLYCSDITLNPLEIINILATATLFQLDGLIEMCKEVMLETINPKTSLGYYYAACQYGDRKLQGSLFCWFLVNLMSYYYENFDMELRKIPVSLMAKLVAHPDLFTVGCEYSLYEMLKYWIYIKHNPDNRKPLHTNINKYFRNRPDKTPYLYTTEGRKFIAVFQGLRIQNLISIQQVSVLILKDNIIPKSWLNPVVLQHWMNMLKVNESVDIGPINVSDELFKKKSLRYGRIFDSEDGVGFWWRGFHFGVDLLMIFENKSISIKWNLGFDSKQRLSFQQSRHIAIRVIVVRVNEQKQITFVKNSKIQKISLKQGEEATVMRFDEDPQYPLIILANVLYTTPDDEPDHFEEPFMGTPEQKNQCFRCSTGTPEEQKHEQSSTGAREEQKQCEQSSTGAPGNEQSQCEQPFTDTPEEQKQCEKSFTGAPGDEKNQCEQSSTHTLGDEQNQCEQSFTGTPEEKKTM